MLRPTITHEEQPYVDEAIYAKPKECVLQRSVEAAYGEPKQVRQVMLRRERVRLRWMKPDGKGGLVPL